MNVFDLFAKISLDTSGYETGLSTLSKGADKITKKVKVVAAAATAAAGAFVKDAISTGQEFDKSMAQVAATMGKTTDEIGELREFAQKMGSETVFSATQAADALNYMALAGYDAETSMSMLPNVLNLAAAGNIDLAYASDMVTDSQTALGLSLKDTNVLVDQMARAASITNTSVSQLGEAILTVGGTAQFMTGGTKELTSVLGVLADNGIKGSEAGTHLRNMLLKLSSPTEEGARYIEKLGVKIFDAQGKMRSFADIFPELNDAMTTLTSEQKLQALSEIFNSRDIAAAQALLGTTATRWSEIADEIDNAQGAAERMAETQLDNLAGDMTLLQSAAEGAKISFSDGLTPALRNVIQMVTRSLSKGSTQRWLKDVGQKLGDLIERIAKGVSNALPRLLKLFDDGAIKLKIFAGVIAGTVIAIRAAEHPILGLATAFGALVGAAALATLTADDATKGFSKLTDKELEDVEAIEMLISSYDDLSETRDKSFASIDEETKKTQDLWEELQTLVDENGKVKKGYEDRAKYITDELSEALGVEFEWNGKTIKQYQEMQTEIDNLIKKRQAERYFAAHEETYTTAKEGLPGIQRNITDLEQLIREAEGELALWEDSSENLVNTMWAKIFGGDTREDSINNLKNYIAELKGQYNDAIATEAQYYFDIDNYTKAETALLEGRYQDVIDIYEKQYVRRYENLVKTKKVNKEELTEIQHQARAARAAVERYRDQLLSGNETYNETTYNNLVESANKLTGLYEEARKTAVDNGEKLGRDFPASLGKAFELALPETKEDIIAGVNSLFADLPRYEFKPSFQKATGNDTTVVLEIDKKVLAKTSFALNQDENVKLGTRIAAW